VSAAPRVTVAVTTHQRAPQLPALVKALEAQTLPPDQFEVVIVDDGSTDGTTATLQELAAGSPLRIVPLRNDVNRGIAAGRNAGWRAALAPLVAFTDDDCIPGPRWLEAGLAAFDGGAEVVVGRTVPPPGEERLADGPFARAIVVEDVQYFETCNVFYRRADLEAAGGFDESFGTHGGEDVDLGLRVKKLGRTARFAPTAVVYHRVRPSNWWAAMRETFRWRHLPLVVRRHPELRNVLYGRVFWKRAHVTTGVAVSGLALALLYPAALLLAVPWVHHRTRTAPLCPGPRRRWFTLPGAFALDTLEVVVMIESSIRHRAVLL
jgi:GT2 family glycosyltransferase